MLNWEATEEKSNNSLEDFNIFNEIKDASAAKKEILDEKSKKEKDVYDYILFYWNIIKIIDFVLLFIIIVFWAYIYIQKSDISNNSYLNLICPLILWSELESHIWSNDCSSITAFNSEFTTKLNTTKKTYFENIGKILPDLYSTLYTDTKEKEFLLNKTNERLKVLEILQEFIALKNGFDIDKQKVTCENITITSEKTLKLDCQAYSSEWDSISWYSVEEKVNGKSISVALSFLDYIKNKSTKFTVINKQKDFSQDLATNWFYIYKTSFTLEMKYNWDNLTF